MAKTIVTLDRNLVNYENIVYISIEQGDYSGDNGEVTSDVYGLIAIDVGNNMHVLGVYEDKSKAAAAENKLRKWLDCEAFGVYDLESKGDE